MSPIPTYASVLWRRADVTFPPRVRCRPVVDRGWSFRPILSWGIRRRRSPNGHTSSGALLLLPSCCCTATLLLPYCFPIAGLLLAYCWPTAGLLFTYGCRFATSALLLPCCSPAAALPHTYSCAGCLARCTVHIFVHRLASTVWVVASCWWCDVPLDCISSLPYLDNQRRKYRFIPWRSRLSAVDPPASVGLNG